MDLKETFLRTLSFLHKGEPPFMSFEHLILLLMVDRAGAITVGDLAKRLKLPPGSVLQQMRHLRTYKVEDAVKGLNHLAVDSATKPEDRTVTITSKGRAFILDLELYVEKSALEPEG